MFVEYRETSGQKQVDYLNTYDIIVMKDFFYICDGNILEDYNIYIDKREFLKDFLLSETRERMESFRGSYLVSGAGSLVDAYVMSDLNGVLSKYEISKEEYYNNYENTNYYNLWCNIGELYALLRIETNLKSKYLWSKLGFNRDLFRLTLYDSFDEVFENHYKNMLDL